MKWREDMLDLSHQKLNAELSAMNAAAAQVVTWTSVGAENMDYVAVGSAMQAMYAIFFVSFIHYFDDHDDNELADFSRPSQRQAQ